MRLNNPDYLVIIKQVADPANPAAGGATVIAPLPESFAYDTSSNYEAPFAQGMLGGGTAATTLAAYGIRLTTQAMTAQLWQGSNDSNLTLDLEFQTFDDPDKDVRTPVLTLKKMAAPSINAAGLLQSPGPRISLEDTGKLISSSGSTVFNEAKQVANSIASTVGIPGRLDVSKSLTGQNDNLNSNQKANAPPQVENGLGGAQFWKNVIRNQISIQIGSYAFFDSVVIFNAQETWSNQIDARTGLPLHAKVTINFKPLFLVTQQDLDNIFKRRPR